MPDPCFTCNYLQTNFAAEIAGGTSYRCSHCGRSFGQVPACHASSQTEQKVEGATAPVHAVEGTPASAFSIETRGNWNKDVDDIRKAAMWVWGFVLIVVLPTLPTIITVATSGKKAGVEQGKVLTQIFLLTFPLSLGIAIDTAILLYVGKQDKWPKRDEGKWWFWGSLAAVLIGSAWLGNYAGLSAIPEVIPDKVQGGKLAPFIIAGQLVKNYFVLYGPQLFLSSVAVGGFAGWAITMKILPNMTQPRPS